MTTIHVLWICGGVLVTFGCSADVSGAEPAPAAARRDANSLGMQMVQLPAGEFTMGFTHSGQFEELTATFPLSIHPKGDELFAADESPRHKVRLTQPIAFSAREVTVADYRRFVNETNYRTTAERSSEGIVGFAPPTEADVQKSARTRQFQRRLTFTWKNPGFEQGDNHPVVGVSWQDAQAFCAWLSKKEKATYRLPTEAEWEYACRARTTTWFSFGDESREIHRFSNLANVELEKAHRDTVSRQWLVDVNRSESDGFVCTAPVASYRANVWGLHDMHGNVWEWCQDRYLELAYRKRTSGTAQVAIVDPINLDGQDDHGDWRVIRGGSWCNAPIMCRSASRGFFDATDASCYVGFRVVRELPRVR